MSTHFSQLIFRAKPRKKKRSPVEHHYPNKTEMSHLFFERKLAFPTGLSFVSHSIFSWNLLLVLKERKMHLPTSGLGSFVLILGAATVRSRLVGGIWEGGRKRVHDL